MTAPVRRALVMAGGGIKVAYQAGVLQVWLDEAGIDMHVATGASGGTLNLAMWCQGYTGGQIADAWRAYRPLDSASLNPRMLFHGPFCPSMMTQRGLRKRVFPGFGLDWNAIRTSGRQGAFDTYNFTAHEHRAVPAAEMTEDLLASAVALPWWFNPVRIGSDTYIDAVFATDANLDEAIRLGATELWVVWTVSTRGIWRGGFVNGYFQMIEAMANAGLRSALRRIEDSNAAIAAGHKGQYPHPVKVRLLAAEVPLHYLVAVRRGKVRRAVELGVQHAREWCAEREIPLNGTGSVNGSAPAGKPAGISFHERMTGQLRVGDIPPEKVPCALELDVTIADVEKFVADPAHTARVQGYVDCPALGEELPIRSGTVHLLAEKAAGDLRMSYDLTVTDRGGRTLRFLGEKLVHRDTRLDLWRDTTTLYTTVHDVADHAEIAAGVLRLTPAGLLRQLATMRGKGGQPVGALTRFLRFFLGRLADTYLTPPVPRSLPAWLRHAGR